MNEGRTKKSIKNLFYAYLGQIVNVLLKFVVRYCFVKNLTTEYLGLSGLFGNILTFLSFAELGIGGAVTYNLYVELARNNTIKIKQLMRLYRKAYIIIGCFILVVGGVLSPFIDFFIAGECKIEYLHLIFFLYVLNTGTSYFFSYKASYITANQENYIVTNINLVSNIIIACVQLIVLFVLKNYIGYLLVQIIIGFTSNVVMAFIANKKYPILKEHVEGKLDDDSKYIITQNVFAAIFHKIGGIVVFSTDNLLISKIFGLTKVGLYSNYTLITKTLQGIYGQFFSSITASVGNLCSAEGDDKKQKIFFITEYINFLIYSFSSICIFELMENFISLWIGSEFLMEKNILYLLCINFYLEGMRCTVQTFNGSMGLARFYKIMPIPESLINLGVSIILAKRIGPVGILSGTTISTLATCFWIEPFILFKHGFSSSIKKYWIVYIKYFIMTCTTFAIIHFINSFISTNIVIVNLFIHAFVCLVLFGVIIILVTKKSEEYNYLKNLIKRGKGK